MSRVHSSPSGHNHNSMLRIRQIGQKISGFIGKGGVVLANVTSLGIIIMIVIGTIDILGTKIFNTPLPTTYESTEALLVIVTFGGLAFVQKNKMHIKADILLRHFSPKLQIFSELVGNLLGLGFFFIFTWYAGLLFWDSFLIREHAEALVPFPIYPSKFAMLLGVGLFTVQLFIDTVDALLRLFKSETTAHRESKNF